MTEIRARTKDEAKAYYEKTYPWLSRVILADAAYRLAQDILFEKVEPEKEAQND